jgi:uncharacterized phage protein (TIGR02220 family)
MHPGLLKAIRYFGTQQVLADMLGVKQQAVSNWLNRETEIPYLKVLQIVQLSKGYVNLKELAPYRHKENDAINQLVKILNGPQSTTSENLSVPPYTPQKPKAIKRLIQQQKGNIYMREYAKISPRFWSEIVNKEIKKLGPAIIVTSLYIQTCQHSNMIGIYHLPIPYISFDTGLSEESVVRSLMHLQKINFCVYDTESNYIWIKQMASEQICEYLDIKDKRVKYIKSQLAYLPELPFLEEFYFLYKDIFHLDDFINDKDDETVLKDAPCKDLQSQEQKQEQNKKQEQSILSGKLEIEKQVSCVERGNISKNLSEEQLDEEAIAILEFLNQKTNKNFRLVSTNLKFIKARLISGVTSVQCRQVIAKKTRDWLKDPRMNKFLRPATIFHPVNFEQYLGELVNIEFEDEAYEK